MMLTDQVFDQAALLAGQPEGQTAALLRILCQSAVSMLEHRLRENLYVEDCREDFVSAAGLLALAALKEAEAGGAVEAFQVGDLNLRCSGQANVAHCLRQQAEQIMAPFLKDCFVFQGV